MAEKKTKSRHYNALEYFFLLYGQEKETRRIEAYELKLQNIPIDVLKAVLNKLVLTNKFLPSIAEIVEAGRNLMGEANGTRTKTWAEAKEEIKKGVENGYTTEQPPKWSTPEIAYAVKVFGWRELFEVTVEGQGTAYAQLRRYYEDACARSQEKAINDFVLDTAKGKNGNLLQGPDSISERLQEPIQQITRAMDLNAAIGPKRKQEKGDNKHD